MVKAAKGGKTWEVSGVQPSVMELVSADLMDRALYQAAKGWVIYMCS